MSPVLSLFKIIPNLQSEVGSWLGINSLLLFMRHIFLINFSIIIFNKLI